MVYDGIFVIDSNCGIWIWWIYVSDDPAETAGVCCVLYPWHDTETDEWRGIFLRSPAACCSIRHCDSLVSVVCENGVEIAYEACGNIQLWFLRGVASVDIGGQYCIWIPAESQTGRD